MSDDISSRTYVPGTQIELIREPARGSFQHALFDFDGTISLLREGWQNIMEPVMLEMICGDTKPTPAIVDEVRNFIEESTGIQTLIQMQSLVEMVKKHGLVPESDIKDAAGYKEVYNDRLMVPVRERLARLESGDLAAADATVTGAIEFLRALTDRGLTMYIFSGTDRHDVINEATRLGAASYFSEIWGALPSLEDFSKEKVLREVINTHNLSGEHVLIVGDGPVEIRNAKERDCVALGVCSREDGQPGYDESKRTRLISAGADLLVPDFGELDALIGYLFPN